jgi:hypothetical protein
MNNDEKLSSNPKKCLLRGAISGSMGQITFTLMGKRSFEMTGENTRVTE